jgi:hypothetical protein
VQSIIFLYLYFILATFVVFACWILAGFALLGNEAFSETCDMMELHVAGQRNPYVLENLRCDQLADAGAAVSEAQAAGNVAVKDANTQINGTARTCSHPARLPAPVPAALHFLCLMQQLQPPCCSYYRLRWPGSARVLREVPPAPACVPFSCTRHPDRTGRHSVPHGLREALLRPKQIVQRSTLRPVCCRGQQPNQCAAELNTQAGVLPNFEEVPVLCEPYKEQPAGSNVYVPNTDAQGCTPMTQADIQAAYGERVCQTDLPPNPDGNNAEFRVRNLYHLYAGSRLQVQLICGSAAP